MNCMEENCKDRPGSAWWAMEPHSDFKPKVNTERIDSPQPQLPRFDSNRISSIHRPRGLPQMAGNFI